MITVMLEDASGNCLAAVFEQGNNAWLCGHDDLALLGLVDEYSNTAFGPEDVPLLLQELEAIKKKYEATPSAAKNLEDISTLARRLETAGDGCLIFALLSR